MRFSQTDIFGVLLAGALSGLFGTWCMDRVGALLRKRGWIAGPPPALVAQWFGRVLRSRVSSPRAWAIHYGIGLVLGIGYAGLTRALDGARSEAADLAGRIVAAEPMPWHFAAGSASHASPLLDLGTAVLFGLATSVFAWFLLFPGMGYGAFGARAPADLKLFRTSLVNHAVYGLGVGAAWALLAASMRL